MFSCDGNRPQMGDGSMATDSTTLAEQSGMEADTSTVNNDVNNDAKSADNETDALVLLNAINQNEIDAASEARSKKLRKPVMDYADMLHKAHTDNLNKTLELAGTKGMTLAETNASTEVKTKGMAELDKIKVLEGKNFEVAYLDYMISGHTEALNMFDTQLMKMASSDDVRQHLTDTRASVAMHLEQAKKLKGQTTR